MNQKPIVLYLRMKGMALDARSWKRPRSHKKQAVVVCTGITISGSHHITVAPRFVDASLWKVAVLSKPSGSLHGIASSFRLKDNFTKHCIYVIHLSIAPGNHARIEFLV
jgi:hypothetical protein